jgi:SAM-dependent methyltransferase
MLSKAYSFNVGVARNLGYDVVSFRKGILDQLPLEDGSVDLLVSNCVLNLATDKAKVFKEIHRVLRQGGRAVISDVVSDREIRPEDRDDPAEWADCTVSSMSLRGFLEAFTGAGLVALRQIAEEPWRQVKGYHLSSITLEARKFETDCHAGVSHLAIYLGPFAEVKDDFGNAYPRFRPVAIRDDVAAFLRNGGETTSFIVVTGKAAPKAGAVKKAAAAPAPERLASPCCDPTDKVTPCCEDNSPKADGSPCCDTLAAVQSGGCGCSPATQAAPAPQEKAASPPAASGCCDGDGCGSAAATPTQAPAQVRAAVPAASDECCPCETQAKDTGTECCGNGCGTCGCE